MEGTQPNPPETGAPALTPPPALSPAPTFLPPPPPPGDVPVLQKLSNPPFPKGKFPLMGILASVYEHVTQSWNREGH